MILKMKSPLMTQLIIEMKKKVGLIRAYFVFSIYNVENNEKIHLKNSETIKVNKDCCAMKDIQKVSSGMTF